jgi:GNAT superfamily N-acetyltransferase
MRIHHARIDDAMRVRAVRLRALADAPDAFSTTLEQDRARPDEDWRARLSTDRTATFLATTADGDVGMAVGAPYDGSPGAAGLFGMWVDPRARGGGVGGALVDAVLAWARSRGYRRILLDVGDENAAAIALYARRGFVPNGVTGTLPPPRTHVREHQRERAP